MYTFQKYSKFYKNLFKLIFILVAILVPIFWAIIQTRADFFSLMGISQSFLDPYVKHQLSLNTRILAFLASLIPTFSVLYILGLLIKLFSNYEKLNVFSTKVVSIYKKLGLSLIYWSIASFIYIPIISPILSFGNPTGERFLALNITGMNVLSVIVGGIVIFIASVMQKAQKISEENDLTI